MAIRTRVRYSSYVRPGNTTYIYNCVGGKRGSLASTVSSSAVTFYTMGERTIDETGHVPLVIRKPHRKQGGPFDHWKTTWINGISKEMTIDAGCSKRWIGRFNTRYMPKTPLASVYDTFPAEVAAFGPTAWNRFRPGRPQSSAAVFLGELRDLPSMLKQTCQTLSEAFRTLRRFGLNSRSGVNAARRAGGNSLGDKYLLYQFGWAPFYRDIVKMYQTSIRIDRYLREIRENNGKVRRRGGILVNERNTVVLEDGPAWDAVYPSIDTPFYAGTPHFRATSTDEKYIYFKGAFRYFIPDMGTLQWKKRTKRLLYGLTVNAEVIWNLIPWSWLIDWFANIGEAFASLDDGWADNLTAKYAYVMGTRRKTYDYYADVNFVDGQSLSLHSQCVFERKVRVAASPYGFGVTFDSLSPTRLAILAALGYSRLSMKNFF